MELILPSGEGYQAGVMPAAPVEKKPEPAPRQETGLVAVSGRKPLSYEEMCKFAKAALASGAFANLKSATEAVAKIQVGQEVGLSPALALSQVYLVGGVPSFSAHFITAQIKRSRPRYDYRVKILTREKCVGDWYQDGEVVGPDYEWTIEDAKAAGLLDKKGGMWDKYRKPMIFSRWATSGARIFCPDVLNGTQIYTPEELGDKPAPDDVQDAQFTVKGES